MRFILILVTAIVQTAEFFILPGIAICLRLGCITRVDQMRVPDSYRRILTALLGFDLLFSATQLLGSWVPTLGSRFSPTLEFVAPFAAAMKLMGVVVCLMGVTRVPTLLTAALGWGIDAFGLATELWGGGGSAAGVMELVGWFLAYVGFGLAARSARVREMTEQSEPLWMQVHRASLTESARVQSETES